MITFWIRHSISIEPGGIPIGWDEAIFEGDGNSLADASEIDECTDADGLSPSLAVLIFTSIGRTKDTVTSQPFTTSDSSLGLSRTGGVA
jgi:hypothetical protein